MVASRAPSPRSVTRVLVACVVLAGLFLMHGLPASSCAAPVGAAVPSMTAAAMAGHPSSPASTSIDATVATSVAGVAVFTAGSPTDPGGAGAGMAGGTCVSTPPPASDLAGLLALLLLGVAVAGWGDRAGPPSAAGRFRRAGGRRAPPLAGSGLLLSLCISRT